MRELWGKNGYTTNGSGEEVFGKDEWADETFMAYHMGRFINTVVDGGKAELNIPMYVNAWLGPQPKADLPGQWPSGGPVARVMGIYRAVAPSLDLFAPDIYVSDFKGTCALYNRSGNPLFIPEARDQVGNLFWALGHHAALGWSPFGVEDLNPDGQVAQAYKLLSQMLPQFAEWQAAGKVNGILVVDGEKSDPVSLGGYKISLSAGMGLGTEAPKPDSGADLAGDVSLGSRALLSDNTPLFPFGFGLSYTTFSFDKPTVDREKISAKDKAKILVVVTNTRSRAGDEVVQMCIHHPVSSVVQPVIALRGFKRIHLDAGKSATVTFEVGPGQLSILGTQMKRTVEPGKVNVLVGANSAETSAVQLNLAPWSLDDLTKLSTRRAWTSSVEVGWKFVL
jgi:hypothetical protein